MKDIDNVIARARELMPQLRHAQLTVTHPADNDGIWYFTIPEFSIEVQLESSNGQCPFLIEHDAADERFHASTVDEAVQKLCELLQ